MGYDAIEKGLDTTSRPYGQTVARPYQFWPGAPEYQPLHGPVARAVLSSYNPAMRSALFWSLSGCGASMSIASLDLAHFPATLSRIDNS